jgi:hypothetical protein
MKHRQHISDLCSYLLIALFVYTAANKLSAIPSFASTLSKSPLIASYSTVVAWATPIAELFISLLLILSATRKNGLQASLALMAVFTAYLSYMVFSGSKLPCHCGGAISTLSWNQHIWFNIVCIGIAYTGVLFSKSLNR